MTTSVSSAPLGRPMKLAKIRPGSCLAKSWQNSPPPRPAISSTRSRAVSVIHSSMMRTRLGVKDCDTMERSLLCSGSSMARKELVATWTTSGKSSIKIPGPEAKSPALRTPP